MTPNNRDLIWSIAELLRGDYKRSEYQKAILPLAALRRLDSVLEPTKAEAIARNTELDRIGIVNRDPVLCSVSDHQFYNTSPHVHAPARRST